MFEVQDLAVASPATVSRCGMVYLEPSYIGLAPFVECWLRFLPENIEPYKDKLQELFDKFMEVCLCIFFGGFYSLSVVHKPLFIEIVFVYVSLCQSQFLWLFLHVYSSYKFYVLCM